MQAEPDAAVALRRARENNDFLASQVQRHPTRYAGFATLPMHVIPTPPPMNSNVA
ncbi:hypothetical protein ACU4GD_36870 [Cupriavidus basilensis]